MLIKEMNIEQVCCYLSYVAYQDDDTIERIMTYNNIDNYRVIYSNAKSNKALYVNIKGVEIISIRGSYNLRNWMQNFNIGDEEGMYEGFFKVAKSLSDIKLNNPNMAILCGHSAGGAIAGILHHHFIHSKSCYMFAAPAFLDDTERREVDKNTAHYFWNNLDGVPISTMSLGFKYSGELIYYDRKGKRCKNPTAFYIFADRLMTADKKDWWEDHDISDYMNLLGIHK